MYEKTIKYLEEKAHRNKQMHGSNKSHKDYAMGGISVSSRNRSGMDGRNPYGSKGGYVRDSRSGNRSDYAKDYRRNSVNNSNNDYRRNDRRMRNQDYDDYDDEEEMMEDEAYYDYNDYAEEDMMKEYEEELKKWIKKLMKKDKFKLPKQEILKKAQEMNIEFEDFSEEEFYAVYLMLVSDYPNIADNPHTYIVMAKQFLEDDDVNVDPSEKVCKYLYEIVLNEE
jgi:hypothetical protein